MSQTAPLTPAWQPPVSQLCRHCRHGEVVGDAIWCPIEKQVSVFSCWRFEREVGSDDE